MWPVLLSRRVKGMRELEMGYGSIRMKDATQVAVMTLAAWDLVCHVLEISGLQMALYRSREMATRLNVDTLTETPAQIKNPKTG